MPEAAPAAAAAASDVFVSYAREDRDAAQALAAALGADGLSVWWDRELVGGEDFADVIAAQLAAARRVVVLWSGAAIASGFVRDEAARARNSGRLLPVRIEEVALPLGFGTLHTLDLLDWDGARDDPGYRALLAALQRAPGAPVAIDVPPRRGRGWRRPLPLLLAAGLIVAAAGFGWQQWRAQQARIAAEQQLRQARAAAEQQLQLGLEAHFARDRNLQAARNAYLSALRADPQLGRAHYYLGHVYALLVLPRDAREQFTLALRFAADLDPAQRDDATVQLAALASDDGRAPIEREVPRAGGAGAAGAAAAEAPAAAAPPAAATPPAASPGLAATAADGAPTAARSEVAAAAQPPPSPPRPSVLRPSPSRAPAAARPDAAVVAAARPEPSPAAATGVAGGTGAGTGAGRGSAAAPAAHVPPAAGARVEADASLGTSPSPSPSVHPQGGGSASAIGAIRPAAAPATLPAPTSAALSRTPSVAQLPRLPPSPEQQRLVEVQADALFAALPQTRLQAATTLALDPAQAADALPLAIERALGLLRNPPVDEAGAAGAANTVQLLLAAGPATLRQHAEAALQLADAVAAMGSNQAASAQQLRSRVAQARSAKPPVAYLQIASDAQRPLAAAIGARLAAAGYAVPAVEKVGARAPSRTEVRIQGGSAPDWGRWLAKVVGELTAGPVKLGSLHSVRPATDTFEIWLAPELCVSRHVPACGA